jgi:hypothetical protein
MNAIAKQRGKAVKYRRIAKSRVNGKRNSYVDAVSPATVSEIQKTLGVKPSHVRDVVRALQSVGGNV